MARSDIFLSVLGLVVLVTGCDRPQPPAKRLPEALTVIEEPPPPASSAIRLEQARHGLEGAGRPNCLEVAREDEAAAAEAEQFRAALVHRLRSGRTDPAREAAAAAAQGRFGLIWAMPLGDAQPVTVRCDGPTGGRRTSRGGLPLNLATYTISDVAGADLSEAGLMGAYGKTYNQAMLKHPAFPYADICRISNDWTVSSFSKEIESPKTWVGPKLAPTDHPRTLGEAARRGTPAALDRWIARDKGRLDQADDFGMTPLAWAVAHDRPVAVRKLLRAGADPYPRICRLNKAASPLYMALALRRPYAEAMAGYGGLGKTRPWPGSLIRLAVETDQVALVRRILTEPWEGASFAINPERTTLSPAMRAMLDDHQARWEAAEQRRRKVNSWVEAERSATR